MWAKRTTHPTMVIVGLAIVLSVVATHSFTIDSFAAPLPELQHYPLPDRLVAAPNIQPSDHPTADPCDNYFEQLTPLPIGALIWTRFPLTVRLDLSASQAPRQTAWLTAVRQAIADWNVYLPIVEVTDLQPADITIRRASVPIARDAEGRLQRIRFAETQYTFYSQDDRLWHRITITLSPNQADASMLAGARHELGHGLGLWGHSDRPSDVMYFSQVQQPPAIAPRDVNTLRRVYGSPTRLGGLLR
jgi:predicted Zn-dependent protease